METLPLTLLLGMLYMGGIAVCDHLEGRKRLYGWEITTFKTVHEALNPQNFVLGVT